MAGFFGIGTDLVEVERMARSIARERFVEEVFGPRERAYCESTARPGEHFAARFAAKEAFLKAIGVGLFSGVALADIEVVNEESGRPAFALGPSARAALERVGASEAFVTLSHVKSLATATVVVRS
ncbi:MAG: holo-ACP synthase [Myxococcaceae bacterium]|nr:holo-ACP synthase [Myxococcaceae bacterium]MBR2979116.1 holo-ACP synthase [Myxococcaceae bacterium]